MQKSSGDRYAAQARGIRAPPVAAAARARLILGRIVQRRVNGIALVALVVVLITAAFAPAIATHDPLRTAPREAHEGPSLRHWMGTDEIGRDIFSRLVYGARVSVLVGFVAVAIAVVLGSPLGLFAAFRGGMLDEVVMRVMDALYAVPGLLLAIGLATALGPSLGTVMVAIGIANVPRYARLMRGTVLSVKENEYVLASRALGASGVHIGLRHLLPNSVHPIIVQAALSVGFAIFNESALGFLGVGVQPPDPSWGSMLREGYQFMEVNLVEAVAPGAAVFITVLSVNLVGDGVREALDPRMRGT